jgi:threonine dehydrogenase-like Zn-dependent dehydrogenase
MHALVFTAAGRVELRTEPDPIPAEGETLVRIRASAICGSELHGFRSVGFRQPPMIMGHEFVGLTQDGVRVVVNPLLSCGVCPRCQAGDPQLCATRALIGVHRNGGFADLVAVPTASVHPVPDNVSSPAATLIEPLANAVHALTMVARIPDRLAVIGSGPIGLVCALAARDAGAEVTLAETSVGRRQVAEKLGFEVVEHLAQAQQFDVVVDAVGAEPTRHASTVHLAPGGTAIWLGLASDETPVAGSDVVRSEKRIVGSFAYRPAEFQAATALAGTLDLSWTTQVPLSAAEETFYALAEGRSDIVKAVLVPDHGAP